MENTHDQLMQFALREVKQNFSPGDLRSIHLRSTQDAAKAMIDLLPSDASQPLKDRMRVARQNLQKMIGHKYGIEREGMDPKGVRYSRSRFVEEGKTQHLKPINRTSAKAFTGDYKKDSAA